MTRLELKMILKLIDLHTTERDSSRECTDKIISNISGLKKDITELFDNENIG